MDARSLGALLLLTCGGCSTSTIAVKSMPDASLISRAGCLFPSIPPAPASDNQVAILLTQLNAYAECLEARFDALSGFITAK